MHVRLEQIARHCIAPAVLITLSLIVSYCVELLTFSNTHAIFLWRHDTGEFGSVPHLHRLALPLGFFPLAIFVTLALFTFLSYGLLRSRSSTNLLPVTDSARTEESLPLK